jgi:hypothetical protein
VKLCAMVQAALLEHLLVIDESDCKRLKILIGFIFFWSGGTDVFSSSSGCCYVLSPIYSLEINIT